MEYDQDLFPTWVITLHVLHASLNDKPTHLVNLEVMDLLVGKPSFYL